MRHTIEQLKQWLREHGTIRGGILERCRLPRRRSHAGGSARGEQRRRADCQRSDGDGHRHFAQLRHGGCLRNLVHAALGAGSDRQRDGEVRRRVLPGRPRLQRADRRLRSRIRTGRHRVLLGRNIRRDYRLVVRRRALFRCHERRQVRYRTRRGCRHSDHHCSRGTQAGGG